MSTVTSDSRRQFIKMFAMAGGGLLLGVSVLDIVEAEGILDDALQPNAFVRITPDGQVTVIVGYSEMGQGILTALPTIVAEELDADWSKVRFEQAPAHPAYTNPRYGIQGTGGSNSVAGAWDPMRKAGATARAMLVAAAARRWDVDVSECRTENSFVVRGNGDKMSYGELATAASKLPVPADVRLKAPRDYQLVGKSRERLDTPRKINGSAVYGLDVRLPGMVTAVIARPPVVGGKLGKFNANKAKRVRGVQHVIELPSGIAVVADGYWNAKLGRDALEIVWDDGPNAALSSTGIQDELRKAAEGSAAVVKNEGNADEVISRESERKLEAAYEVPFLAQACMEPMNFTAWVKADGVEVYGGTQAQTSVQKAVAKDLGIKPEQVKVTTTLLGGGFGRRFAVDFVRDAVMLSKQLGVPVHVVYSREDDMRAHHYRPAAYAKMTAVLGADGRPSAARFRLVSPSIWRVAGYPLPNGVDRTSVEGFLTWPYEMPNLKLEWTEQESPVTVWFWRAVGYSQNGFFMESMIDEMATEAGEDPLEYRRRLLSKSVRLRTALETVGRMAGWGMPGVAGRHLGVACSQGYGTALAMVAEVSVSAQGAVTVHRISCAVDCGIAVNPDTIKRQIQSAVVYGLSATFWGNISLKGGQVEQSNFHDYPVLRISQMPTIDVQLIPSSEAPGGIGEAGLPPVAPAIVNAIYAATKRRVRKLPVDAPYLAASRSAS